MRLSSTHIALCFGLCCLLPGCDDGGTGEPGTRDAEVDAGRVDASADDASSSDGSALDGQADDAGSDDASDAAHELDAAPDAARDASAPDAKVECSAVAPTACPEQLPTYLDIAKIVERRCESCHSPYWTGPWPLDTYEHVADWQDAIREHLLDCTMPPVEGGGPLSKSDSDTFLLWLRCGLPE